MPISKKDRNLLRDLAKQVAEIASLPVMDERRELWKRHNSLDPVRPMILVFPEQVSPPTMELPSGPAGVSQTRIGGRKPPGIKSVPNSYSATESWLWSIRMSGMISTVLKVCLTAC